MLQPSRLALLRAGVRDLVRRPLHSLLMLAGVALGVAVMVAIDLANQSASTAFELSTQAVVGRATHRVVGGPRGISTSLYRQLRVEAGVDPIAPVIEGVVSLGDRPIRLLGIDPFAELPFRGRLGQATPFVPEFAAFYTAPNQVILTQALAQAIEAEPGDLVEVQAVERVVALEVLGVLSQRDGVELMIMDVAAVQELLGMEGRLTRIDVIADEATAEQLRALLPAGVRLETAGSEVDTAQQLTSAFTLNLTALSLLELVVGMFLIYNTMSFAVLRRRVVFGTLRSLGVGGGELRLQVLFESAVIGAAGVISGILLGWWLSQAAVGLVSQTINDFYFVLSVRQTELSVAIAVKAAALGLGASIAAAAIPAWEASQVPPVQVLRRSESEVRARAQLPALARIGVLMAVGGTLVFLVSTRSLPVTFGSMMIVLVGLALTVPWATDRVFTQLSQLKLRSSTRMAVRAVTGHISRTGLAVASLMVALSVSIGVTLMISSFRTTVENWLAVTLQSDLYVSSPTSAGTRPQASLPAALQQQVAQVPGVAQTEALRAVIVRSDAGELHLSAVDPERVRDARLYRLANGTADQVWQQVIEGAVLVSESLTFRTGIREQVTLLTDRGQVRFPVAAVFYDYSTDRGTLLMSREVYQQYWDDPTISSIGATVASGQTVAEVVDRIRRQLSGTGLEVIDNAQIRQEALQIFDRTFAITGALRLLAVAVAVIGVVSALMALQLERAREYATLNALGMAPGGLQRLTVRETLYLGAAAAVLSIPTGVLLALALIHVINARSFGWTIWLYLTPLPLLQALAAGVGAALLAAVYPALRIRRIAVAAALSQE